MMDMDKEGFEMYGRSTTVTTRTARKGKLDPDNISEESFCRCRVRAY
jgi:hypothetical protein